MSTILKALKQSEARRPREGSLPAGLPEAGRRSPARGSLPWLAGGMAALAAGVVTWTLWPGEEAVGPEPRARRIAEVSMPEHPSTDTRSGDDDSSASAASAGAEPPAEPAGRPEAGSSDADTVKTEPDRETAQPPIANPRGEKAPSGEPDEAVPEHKVPEGTSSPREQTLDPYALLPRLEHLPAARRGALPKLNLNAHVFAPEPGQSFVLINLERYREGDRVAPGLTVAEIFRGGVVMEDGEGRFVLARP